MDIWVFFQWSGALFAVEAALVVGCLVFPLRFGRIARYGQRLAGHRLAPLAVAGFALLLRAALLPVEPVPSPAIHDEFSYLLSADTFAHGRLTNPTHPMWEHFETFQVDHFPSYHSIYPPLAGLILAAGQVVAGSPFAGVWLTIGLMCGTLCWALRAWLPPRWALLAGVIAAIRLGTFSYWGDSYWGGALVASGGAMVFGALPRLVRRSRWQDALLGALGVAILANTRPYEGLVFTAAVGLLALWQVRKLRLRAILPPAAALLLCVGALMAYYNWRVFGSPTTMPYTVNRKIYSVAPIFSFQPPYPWKLYRHEAMRTFYEDFQFNLYRQARTFSGLVRISFDKLNEFWNFFIGPVLTIPLLASFGTWKCRRTRILWFVAGAMAGASLVTPHFAPHYIAPATVVIYALLMQGMRVLHRTIPRMVPAVPLICVLLLLVRAGLEAAPFPLDPAFPNTWARKGHPVLFRDKVAAELEAQGGKHLVIVHYGPQHSHYSEYVFNGADIDGSPVVWARDMGSEKNAELVNYFHARKLWVLNPDQDDTPAPYRP